MSAYPQQQTNSRPAKRLALALAVALSASAISSTAMADSSRVEMSRVSADGVEQSLGHIRIEETEHGLLFSPELESLEEGMHGFHVHEHGSCDPAHKDGEMAAAESAGGHFDPQGTGKHLGPYAEGHLGDLPALYVNDDGKAEMPVLAPRLTSIEQLDGRTLMIHAGGDNYADEPEPLGGGGSRVACGVI